MKCNACGKSIDRNYADTDMVDLCQLCTITDDVDFDEYEFLEAVQNMAKTAHGVEWLKSNLSQPSAHQRQVHIGIIKAVLCC